MKALVTGAGARLGQAMAIYLGQRGYDVAVHYAGSLAGAQDTVAQLRAMGRQAVALQPISWMKMRLPPWWAARAMRWAGR
jgi:short chain dehydrogenase.